MLHMDRQARTRDRVLAVKSREITGRGQTLPWWLEEKGQKQQNTLNPLRKGMVALAMMILFCMPKYKY
jgi:hypothetical protein